MVATTRNMASNTQTEVQTGLTSQSSSTTSNPSQSTTTDTDIQQVQPTAEEVAPVEEVVARPANVTMTCTIEELVRATTGSAPAPPSTRSKLKPPAHSMDTDMQQYLQLFATVARHNNWDNTEAAVQLRCYLTGQAQTLSYLHPEYNFTQLENLLIERFALSPVDARYRIRRLARSRETTHEELADEIHKLVRTGHGHRLTPEQIEEEEVEVFLDALDWPDLAMHITTAGVTNLHAAIRIARTYQGFKDRRSSNRTTPKFREFDHQPTVELETLQEIRSSLQQITAQQQQKVECYFCKGNHYASGCPDKPVKETKKEKKNQNQGN